MSIKKLDRFVNNENRVEYEDYTLENINKILKLYNNPQDVIKTIHIAGTNGKGSTAYMLNGILVESGYKTGLFISPHLLKINERIKINNVDIPDSELNKYIDKIIETIDENDSITPTYFDIITSIAFIYFNDQKINIAIVEVGLGGRLDSTNVITPLCSILTDISLDHTSILGESIYDIANEKSGIIKKNIPIITSNTDEIISNILFKKANELNSKIYSIDNDIIYANIKSKYETLLFDYSITINSRKIKFLNIEINSLADFQVKNSSLAISAALLIKKNFNNISESTIRNALKKIIIPGRFQLLNDNPMVIFDPAHNSSALFTILELLNSRYSDKKIFLIISIMKDKNYMEMLSKIKDSGVEIIYYELSDSRCYKPAADTNSSLKLIVKEELELRLLLNEIKADNS